MTKIHLFWIAQEFLKRCLTGSLNQNASPIFFHILKSSNSLEQISRSHLRFFTNMENTAAEEFSMV